jgi:hypothetical protein
LDQAVTLLGIAGVWIIAVPTLLRVSAPMFFSLLLSTASATEAIEAPTAPQPPAAPSTVNIEVDCDEVEIDNHRDRREGSVSIEGNLLAMPQTGGVAWAVRADGARNGFARIDHRTQNSDSILRGTIGVDLLGWSRLIDLNLGASMATAADLSERTPYGPVAVGLETGFGLNVRSVHLNTRYVKPLGDSEVARGVNERELRLSYDLNEELTVFGNQLRINPDLRAEERVNAYGSGMVYTF